MYFTFGDQGVICCLGQQTSLTNHQKKPDKNWNQNLSRPVVSWHTLPSTWKTLTLRLQLLKSIRVRLLLLLFSAVQWSCMSSEWCPRAAEVCRWLMSTIIFPRYTSTLLRWKLNWALSLSLSSHCQDETLHRLSGEVVFVASLLSFALSFVTWEQHLFFSLHWGLFFHLTWRVPKGKKYNVKIVFSSVIYFL